MEATVVEKFQTSSVPAEERQVGPPTEDLADIWSRLSPSSREAMGGAEGMRRKLGLGSVHIEHLLAALHRKNPGPARFAVDQAGLSGERFLDRLRSASESEVLEPAGYTSVRLTAMPPLSRHVTVALHEARAVADSVSSSSIRSRHLFYGAMSVPDCDVVTSLEAVGVNRDAAIPWTDTADSVAPADEDPGATELPRLEVMAAAQTDQPTSIDRLGYDQLVDALAQLLNGERTTFPLSIAISAPWGAGKSSLMRLLRNRLIEEDRHRVAAVGATGSLAEFDRARAGSWVIVDFPAWRYETGEQLWAAMAKKTYESALASQPHWLAKAAFRLRLEMRRGAVGRLLLRGAALVGAGVIGATAGLAIGEAANAPTEGTALVGGAGGILAVMQALGTSLADPFKKSLESFARQRDVGDGFTLAAARDVDALMDLLLEGDGRLLIMIDDLDRCTPHNLVRVIEAVNQIFVAGSDVAGRGRRTPPGADHAEAGLRKLVFVLGMDRDYVARGIEVEYRDLIQAFKDREDPEHRTYGISFLDKIVQLWVSLPEPELDSLRDLLTSVARQTDHDGRTAAPGAPGGGRASTNGSDGFERGDPGHDVDVGLVRGVPRPAALPPPVDDSEEVTKAIAAGVAFLERNPRKVKRYNNAFRLQFHLASRGRDLTEPQLDAIARWVAIRLRWEELAGAMDAEPMLLRALEIHANNGDRTGDESADYERLRTSRKAWFDGSRPDHRVLMDALRAPTPEHAISRLPFREFLRIS